MKYEIVNSVMMYLTNASLFDFARDVFQRDLHTEPAHSVDYVENKWELRHSGRLWGALDKDNRVRLINAALHKYEVDA